MMVHCQACASPSKSITLARSKGALTMVLDNGACASLHSENVGNLKNDVWWRC